MKTIIIAAILWTGFTCPAAFANDDSANAHLANAVSMGFKITDHISPLNANAYHQTTVVYNGMVMTAFKSNSSNWVGFFKTLSANDLPENTRPAITKKYPGYTIQKTSMYFDTDGDICYFAELTNGKRCIILKIEPTGRINVFNCPDSSRTIK